MRTLLLPALALALVLSAPGLAVAAPLLPLIHISDQGKPVSPWWTRGDLRLSDVESRLVEGLTSRGVEAMDPGALDKPPRVSRIYKVPRLSSANAVNLAGLYGAGRALTGRVTTRTIEGPAGLVGVECTASLSLMAVPGGEPLLKVDMVRRAWAGEETEARARSVDVLTRDLASMVSGAVAALNPPVGVSRDEPYLQVRGLWDQKSIKTLHAALGGHPEVNAAAMSWATEGAVAFDLNPGESEQAAQIQSVASALVDDPPEGMVLTLQRASGTQVVISAARTLTDERP